MPGLFGLIDIGLSAIWTHRNALQVRAQNISNVDTPGYSRQEAILSTNPPIPPAGTAEEIIGGQYGTGVRVTSIYRARESFLGIQARTCGGRLGRFSTAADALRQVESILAPGPGEDISVLLDRFWDAWESVANRPEEVGLRTNLLDTGQMLADTFRDQVQRLNSARLTLDQGIRTRVEEVNALATQVAEYNRQIAVAQAEARSPNDLLDSRDLLLDRLAALTGAMPANSEGGHLILYLDGRPLVEGAKAHTLTVSAGAAGVEIRTSYDGAPVDIQKGEIGGLLYARDTAIPSYLNDLDTLAGGLVTEVNARHQAGFGLDGLTGRDFFLAGTGAGDIALDPAVLADVSAIAAGAVDAPGDGSVALDIANLRTTPAVAGRTLDEVAQALLGRIGTDLYVCDDGVKAQEFALQQIQQQQQSISGVSIDEELTYLSLSQRAYEAAARIVSAADEMIGIVLEQMAV